MHITTTCRDCGGPLPITDTTTNTVHPHCTPKPTRAERLAQQWIDAVLTNDTTAENTIETQLRQLDNQPPKLLEAALRYADWGWLVFPLMPRSKKPATKNGFKAATTDHNQIRDWWQHRPDCNIGLATGHHFDVIDIDLPHGFDAYQQLLTTDLEVHGQVATSRGGIHLYIQPTGRPNRAKNGVDYRGEGGYVVAPPSTLGTPGRSWLWVHHPSPTITRGGQ